MSARELGFLERIEKLGTPDIARCAVYTVISSGAIYFITKIFGHDFREAALCVGWTFNLMLCHELEYISAQNPARVVACYALSFAVAAAFYIVASLLVPTM